MKSAWSFGVWCLESDRSCIEADILSVVDMPSTAAMSLSAAGLMRATSATSAGMRASACRDGTPHRTRRRDDGVDASGALPKTKRLMLVPEVDDPDMSTGNMFIQEMTQAVGQLQAQQLARAAWTQAMTNAMDDHAFSLGSDSK